jgi:Domain of unknown function (DUF2017)
MSEVVSEPGMGARVALEEYEAALLQQLILEMRTVLEDDLSENDGIVARLFPDAYDSPEDSAEFHELTGSELKNGRLEALGILEDSLAGEGDRDISLEPDHVDAWLRMLTDMRLAIGTRLEISDEDLNEDLDPKDPDVGARAVLHWLGLLQESLLGAVTNAG